MGSKKAIVCVTNDLYTDRRVHKTCLTLTEMGFDTLLVGRKLKNSNKMPVLPYKTRRMRLLFNKKAVFYAEYNIRLFFFLLFRPFKIVVSNDLDTLLASYVATKIKRKDIVYDSHEYFLGVPEIQNRARVKSAWTKIEKRIFPKLKDIITVNNSIAKLYKDDYNKDLFVVRNLPLDAKINKEKDRGDLDIPKDKKIIILQGAGINIDRGAEELVESMQFVENAILYIIGSGDVFDKLKEIIIEKGLETKVVLKSRMSYQSLMQYTFNADLGVSLDKPTNINYKYSLPNKLFDYIYAEIPVLVSDLPELKNIVLQYKIGAVCPNHNPEIIAKHINTILDKTKEEKQDITKALKFAKSDICWEKEKMVLKEIFEKYAR